MLMLLNIKLILYFKGNSQVRGVTLTLEMICLRPAGNYMLFVVCMAELLIEKITYIYFFITKQYPQLELQWIHSLIK